VMVYRRDAEKPETLAVAPMEYLLLQVAVLLQGVVLGSSRRKLESVV